MKKLIIVLLMFFVLTACTKKQIKVYTETNVEEFDSVLENVGNGNTKAYDLREYEECYAGRIPGFYCSRVEQIEDKTEALDKVVKNLELLLMNNKKTLIILIDKDGGSSEYVANKLFEDGYTNVHYFKCGYSEYVKLHADFVPETGECDC